MYSARVGEAELLQATRDASCAESPSTSMTRGEAGATRLGAAADGALTFRALDCVALRAGLRKGDSQTKRFAFRCCCSW
jgi:hypothetical protein